MSDAVLRGNDVVGLCGLGNMGGAIASRLARRFRVVGYDVDEQRAEGVRVGHGIQVAGRVEELAAASCVVLCLPSPAVSRQVVSALGPVLAPGSVVVETSTVNPEHVLALAEIVTKRASSVVDAALAAGVAQMAAGTAALLVGGDDADVAKVRPVLEAMSGRVVRLGSLGSGAALKVINNGVAHAVMVVLVPGFRST